MELAPLYNYMMESANEEFRNTFEGITKVDRKDDMNLRQMANSLKRLHNQTVDGTRDLGTTHNENWNEDTNGNEHTTDDTVRTENETTDQDTSSVSTKDTTGKEVIHDESEGTKAVDSSSDTTTGNTRLHSDTPQGVLTSEGLSITETYLTSYTRDSGTQHVVAHDDDKINNTEDKTTDETENVNSDEKGTNDITKDTTENIDKTIDKDYNETVNGDRNATGKEDETTKDITDAETKQFENGSIQDNGTSTTAGSSDRKEKEDTKRKSSNKGFTISQSKLLQEYRKTFLNIDMMIIQELAVNFMGVF